jgi:GR25 family glycosyltransferase involved in LPS biosynthesis
MWTDFFDRIVVINLPKRVDRLIEVSQELDNYGIEFDLVDGIEHEKGAEGLRQTVENILKDSIQKKHKAILIFEDDCLFVEPKDVVDRTMEDAIKDLPEYWHILYLSAQATDGFKRRHSSALLQLDKAFATHSWAISLQGMKEIIAAGLEAPIDNSIVDKVQPMQKCFITYPILTTQRAGVSDIGNTFIDWHPFLIGRYNQKLAELK